MSTPKTLIRLRSARHLSSRPAHMHSNEHYRGPSQWFGNKGKGHCITEGPRTGEVDILFYFQNQANNGTGILCEGLITDLPNSIYLFSICIYIPLIPFLGWRWCIFSGRTAISTWYVHQLVFPHTCMCLLDKWSVCTLVSLRTIPSSSLKSFLTLT